MLTYTAFEGVRRVAHGNLQQVALEVRKQQKKSGATGILIFSDVSGEQMDLDLRGSEKEVLERLKTFLPAESAPHTGPGRPKLGVVTREVSLLPVHWEWLSNQSGGSSAAIRRLIDEKMKAKPTAKERQKRSQETTHRFLTALAGNLPNYEEVLRYLYRKDQSKFGELVGPWPGDVAAHALCLAKDAFLEESEQRKP